MFKRKFAATAFAAIYIAASSATVSAKQLQDPTRPANYIAPNDIDLELAQGVGEETDHVVEQPLVLSAISYSKSGLSRSAIINGKWLKEGAQVDGATIISIKDNTVLLSRNNQQITVQLVPQVKPEAES